jgi:hypothetical protein
MTKIYLNKTDIEKILEVIKENDLEDTFTLIHDNVSGIGYTLDMEFDAELNGRVITAKVNIADSTTW